MSAYDKHLKQEIARARQERETEQAYARGETVEVTRGIFATCDDAKVKALLIDGGLDPARLEAQAWGHRDEHGCNARLGTFHPYIFTRKRPFLMVAAVLSLGAPGDGGWIAYFTKSADYADGLLEILAGCYQRLRKSLPDTSIVCKLADPAMFKPRPQ